MIEYALRPFRTEYVVHATSRDGKTASRDTVRGINTHEAAGRFLDQSDGEWVIDAVVR